MTEYADIVKDNIDGVVEGRCPNHGIINLLVIRHDNAWTISNLCVKCMTDYLIEHTKNKKKDK
jgi:hypothetical protein